MRVGKNKGLIGLGPKSMLEKWRNSEKNGKNVSNMTFAWQNLSFVLVKMFTLKAIRWNFEKHFSIKKLNFDNLIVLKNFDNLIIWFDLNRMFATNSSSRELLEQNWSFLFQILFHELVEKWEKKSFLKLRISISLEDHSIETKASAASKFSNLVQTFFLTKKIHFYALTMYS